MKFALTFISLSLLICNITYASLKNIGNGLTVNIPNGYHYFEITLKQIVSRFPSIDISDYTNSEFGIGANAKLVILANDKKTIKLVEDITSATGLAKLEEQFMSPFEDLMANSEFIDILTSYGKKKFPKIDWEDVSYEDGQIIAFKTLEDKRFLKKIDKYTRPLIDKFNYNYQIDKFTEGHMTFLKLIFRAYQSMPGPLGGSIHLNSACLSATLTSNRPPFLHHCI